MIFSDLVVATAVASAFWSVARGDAGALPANIPLSFDSATRRYVTNVVMGADGGQQAGFTISTGLRYTAVASTKYAGYAQAKTHVYDPGVSASYEDVGRTTAYSYGALALGGSLGREDCGLEQATPDLAPWPWPNQTLVLSDASQSALSIFAGKVSGVMGLATSAPAGGSQTDTVLGHWFALHPDNATFQYGMALDDVSSTSATQQGVAADDTAVSGHLHMLAPNPSFFDSKHVVWADAASTDIGDGANPLSSDFAFVLQSWQFQAPDNVLISSGEPAQATFEPLFPALILPARYARLIYAAIPGAAPIVPSNPQQWTLPCTTTDITWTLTMGTLSLPMKNLVFKNGNTCVGAIEAWSDDTVATYLLGSPFMANAYIIHSTSRSGQNKVGIAPRLTPRSASSRNALIGGLVGGLVGALAIAGVLLYVFWRRISRKERTYANETAEVKPFVVPVDSPTASSAMANPFSSMPGSAALPTAVATSAGTSTGTSTGSFAAQQAAALREAKGRNLFTQAAPGGGSVRRESYLTSTYVPSVDDDDDGRSPRGPLLPPAYE